ARARARLRSLRLDRRVAERRAPRARACLARAALRAVALKFSAVLPKSWRVQRIRRPRRRPASMRTATIHYAVRDASAPWSLDPCTLGRPFHLLDGFVDALKADLSDHFQQELNRRYGASFEVGTVSLVRGVPPDARIPRLLVHTDDDGSLGVALERSLLL